MSSDLCEIRHIERQRGSKEPGRISGINGFSLCLSIEKNWMQMAKFGHNATILKYLVATNSTACTRKLCKYNFLHFWGFTLHFVLWCTAKCSKLFYVCRDLGRLRCQGCLRWGQKGQLPSYYEGAFSDIVESLVLEVISRPAPRLSHCHHIGMKRTC